MNLKTMILKNLTAEDWAGLDQEQKEDLENLFFYEDLRRYTRYKNAQMKRKVDAIRQRIVSNIEGV